MHHNPRLNPSDTWCTCDPVQSYASLEEAVPAEADNAEDRRAEEKKNAEDVVAHLEKKIADTQRELVSLLLNLKFVQAHIAQL